MYEWSMSSIKVSMSIYFSLLTNNLFLLVLKTSVSPLPEKGCTFESISIFNHYNIMKSPILGTYGGHMNEKDSI